MFRSMKQKLRQPRIYSCARSSSSSLQLPDYADVVVIGGGSAGCNALYQLGKHGVKGLLLDKSKLTSGTTWHTGGLVWGLRAPSDVDIELLAVTRNVVTGLERETGINPGWITNGGLFVARSDERMNEYRRMVTVAKAFGIEARLISPRETKELFPLLDESSIRGAIYNSGDGGIDPTMLINALTKSARSNGCQIFEDCPVTKIHVRETTTGASKKIYGVETAHGFVRTDVVLNAAGVWSNNIANMVGVKIPLTPLKHAYVLTEPIEGIQNLPNVRDPDFSLYFRMQGSSMMIGGYEQNPVALPPVPEKFSFGLYELDWNVFNAHVESMTKLIPKLSMTGIKRTICGPESFTPDHKPIMGEDPRCFGFFYSCGYNSAGMMLGGGCGEQIARWIINGRPDNYMFDYDIRRFSNEQRSNMAWTNERSYEAYAKNYNILFPHDEPLTGRNLRTDPFHSLLVEEGAVMEERQGWERPGWFFPSRKVDILPRVYGERSDETETLNNEYRSILGMEYSFDFPPHDSMIRDEALACRNSAAVFNMSYLGKFYICGPDARKAADRLFTANTNRECNRTIYTCALNDAGGVEADCTVTIMEPGSSGIIDPIFKEVAFYIVSAGMSAQHAWSHMNKVIASEHLDVSLHDVTEQIGILSVQGPNSRDIVEGLIEDYIPDVSFKYGTTKLAKVRGVAVRLIRLSFVGELGFELHIPKSACHSVYTALMDCGKPFNMKLAGYRALHSLSCEKGYLLWGSDIRSDDNPIEAGLGFVCRKTGNYLGKAAVDGAREDGIKKKLIRLRLNSTTTPLWGLETIYRNGSLVGYLRRAEKGYSCDNMIGHGYIKRSDGVNVTKEFLESGNYEIEAMGKRYPAHLCV